MSLQISEKNGMFHLNGKINSSTLNFFSTYFNYNLSQSNAIVVNIDNVKEIDRSGLEAIENFTKLALFKEKSFSIVGYGCKEIYDHFNSQVA
ncbi:STAS domain-containing protein [Polaribacter aquimarinus]|uniref:STAS domain-containing protein n=1 Tax=Polaribacter aquimarinus TaxID=2100726 RepID=A0A2U2JEM5_9FLAO|nr:STAS domain-containing protein [Polaribacter aquimarinus]PWG06788.1 hypothetical protein DIS07_02830 [Polaribacter aquimarinus]